MRAPGHRRQVLLFLAAVLAPCLLLVGLSLRMIGQERELAEKRRSDERRLAVENIRQELLARLERMKLEAAGGAARLSSRGHDPEVALAAWMRDGKLAMPWEVGAPEQPGRTADAPYHLALRDGEREEFVEGNAAAALPHYQRALRLAAGAGERARARLLRARALDKTGRAAEALADFRILLAAAPGIRDEEGVPLQLYAAERLAGSPADRAAVMEAARRALNGRPWLPPTACYTLSTVAEKLGSGPLKAEVAVRIRRTGQALGLEADHARLNLRDGLWVLYGEDPWLVSAVPGIMVIAVDAAPVFESFTARAGGRVSGLRFLASGETGGELLGENFPGLKVDFTLAGDGAGLHSDALQRRFIYAVMLVVLCAALYGAYLLWRDLDREVRLAELHAQFVSSVSHELKTPLTAIRMFAETLQMGRSRDPEAQAEYLNTIVNECERLSRLVDGVLTFSKMEQGKKVYRFRAMRLDDAVRAAARAMEYPLAQHGFNLRVELDGALPPVRADHDAIEQAVLNLLSNAMKYSRDRREIELRTARVNGDAVIEVRDYGAGIPPEEQGRIFEKFYRVATPENQQIPGTGLGLTLVAQIAHAHGGRVEVRSAPGEGSTFSIRLPAGHGSAAAKVSL